MKILWNAYINRVKEGDLTRYLRTIIEIIVMVAIYILFDIIFKPENFEGDGTVFGTIYAYIFLVFIFSVLIIIVYTIISPSFLGWMIKKIKRK